MISQPLLVWAPDADPTQPGVIPEATNLLPTQRGYAPDYALLPSLTYTTVIPAAPRGVRSVYLEGSSIPTVLVGTASAIYCVTPSAVLDVSDSTPYTSVTSVRDGWRFDAFGGVALATSLNNPLQESAGPAGGIDFSAISGAPSANCIAVQSEFVMLANFGASTTWPYADGWWCCAAGDHTDWTLDTATFCAQGRLVQTPGQILRLMTFGDEILAFKDRSILRGRFTGQPSQPWAWDIVSTSIGIVGHDAICDAEGVLYWCGLDGFYAYSGGAPQRLPGQPFEWFQRQLLTQANLYSMQAAWDPVRRLVRWAFVGKIFSDIGLERLPLGVAYHPETGRWGPFSIPVQSFVTLQFDDVPSVSQNLVAYTLATSLQRRTNVLGVIESSGFQVQTFRGPAGASQFETTDVGDEDAHTVLTKARLKHLFSPLGGITGTHLYRNDLGKLLTAGESSIGVDGKYDFSQSARWHRIRFAVSGMYELLGMRLRAPRSGDR